MHKFKKKTIVDFSVRYLRDVAYERLRSFVYFFFNLEITKDTCEIPYKLIVFNEFRLIVKFVGKSDFVSINLTLIQAL